MLGEHDFRLGDDRRPVTGRERRLDLDPAGRCDLRLATLAGHVRPLGILVGEQRTADQCERSIGSGTGDREPAVGLRVGRLVDPTIDLVDVEPGCRERVPAGAVDQVVGTEHATQPRHEHSDLLGGLRRELEPPQHVGRPIHRHDLAARDGEQLEQRAGLTAPEVTFGDPIDGEPTQEPDPQLGVHGAPSSAGAFSS